MLLPNRARWKGSINENPYGVSRCFHKLNKTAYWDISLGYFHDSDPRLGPLCDSPWRCSSDNSTFLAKHMFSVNISLIALEIFTKTAHLILNRPDRPVTPSDPAYLHSRDLGWFEKYYDTCHRDFSQYKAPKEAMIGPDIANILHADTLGAADLPHQRRTNGGNCRALQIPLCQIPLRIGRYLLPQYILSCAHPRIGSTIRSDIFYLYLTLAEYCSAARCIGMPCQQRMPADFGDTERAAERLADVPYISNKRVVMLVGIAELEGCDIGFIRRIRRLSKTAQCFFTRWSQSSSWSHYQDTVVQEHEFYRKSTWETRITNREGKGKWTTQQAGSGSEKGQESHKRTAKDYKSSSCMPSGPDRKRTVNSEGCQDDEYPNGSGQGGDEHSPDKRRRLENEKTPRLACPFYKHNPAELIDERVCCGPGWSSVNRVKEHIFRRHSAPEFECSRCFADFKTDRELNDHYRDEQRCEIRERSSPLPLVDSRTEKLLKQRGKSTNLMTEEEKWSFMYKLIFPNETQIPSPYYELKDLARDVAFPSEPIAQEMFRRNLAETLPAQSLIDPALMDSIVRGTMAAFNKTISSIYEQGMTLVSDATVRNSTADIGGSRLRDTELDAFGKNTSLAGKEAENGSTDLSKVASQLTSAKVSEPTACSSETGPTQLSKLSGENSRYITQSPRQVPAETRHKPHICGWPGCGKIFSRRSNLIRHQQSKHAGDETKSEHRVKSTKIGDTEDTPPEGSLNEFKQKSGSANLASFPETGAQNTVTSYGGCGDDQDGTIAPIQLPTRFNSWASSSTAWPFETITPEYGLPGLSHSDWMFPENLINIDPGYDGDYSFDNYKLPGE